MIGIIVLFLLIQNSRSGTVSSEIEYHTRLQKFMNVGVTGIIWSEVDFKSVNVSKVCKLSLLLTKKHIERGSIWAHASKCDKNFQTMFDHR